MPLIPLDIPPGMRRVGTDMQASGRWRDGNLVRWREGTIRPVGGWRIRNEDAFDNVPRGMHVWEDNANDRHTAAGSYNKLWAISASGTVSDITPTGLTAGNLSATLNTGYGGGFYGLGFYGTERQDTGSYSEATTWALDNFGQYLVACSNADGKLYEWQLSPSTAAAQISNSPTGCLGLMVTEERFLFALGAGNNPRKVQWCDREDNTTWTAAATNEAGDIELQTSGQIMCGLRTRGQALILTDIDAHTATYQGPPFVYGFERVGTSCGIVSRKAAAVVDGGAFWMGQRNFFQFDGSNVSQLPCEVSDYVFGDINRTQISKAWAVANAQHGEIWWFYPSGSSSEVDRYVALDYKEGHWHFGSLARTCGVDRGVFRYPLWASTGLDVLEHEVGLNYDGDNVFAETGPVSIGAGDATFSVNKLYPDEKTQGDVTATFKTRFYPNDTERSYGPYTMSNPTSVRFSGRQIRMRIDGVALSDWRVGIPRIDAFQRGKR